MGGLFAYVLFTGGAIGMALGLFHTLKAIKLI
jgi:hypothetical protein